MIATLPLFFAAEELADVLAGFVFDNPRAVVIGGLVTVVALLFFYMAESGPFDGED